MTNGGYGDTSGYWNYGAYGYQPPPGYLLVQDPRVANGQGQAQYPNVTQNAQPAVRIQQVPARFVENEEEIKPNEVPSDGSISVFIRNDCQEIYAKQLNKNGIIQNVTYVPSVSVSEAQDPSTTIEERLNKMESLMEERFSKIEKILSRRNGYYKKPAQNRPQGSSEKEV